MSPWRLEASESEDDALWRLHPERQRLIASDTAALLVRSVGAESGHVLERLKAFVDAEGLDTLAELWSHSEPGSLPRALWRLFQIRDRVVQHPSEASYLLQGGIDSLHTIDPVVVGAEQPVTPETMAKMIDEILSGTFTGNLGEALERAASLSRLISAGLLSDDPGVNHETALHSLAWSDVASELALCAKRERNGNLR